MISDIKISIGMPVFNGGKYIREALDCLLAQTFVGFELIISDNASADDTQMICQEYAQRDQRVKYIRQHANRGALANFQFVLDQAQGEYFMWAAADDKWDVNWLDAIYTRISGQHNLAGFGELTHIDSRALALKHPANGARLEFCGSRLKRKIAFYLVHESFGKANLFYALYPRKILEGLNLQDYYYDYEMLFRIIDDVEYVQIKNVRLYKRVHSDCTGVAANSIFRKPYCLTPFRALSRDAGIAISYFKKLNFLMILFFIFLVPVKTVVGCYLYSRKASILLFKKVFS